MRYVYLFHIAIRSLLPLVIGGLIYIFYGTLGIRLVDWATQIGFINKWRTSLSLSLPDWVIFNLTDGIWLFSLLQLIDIIWQEEKGGHIWLALSVIMAIGHELGQLFNVFSGTFDWLDILAYAIVSVISILISQILKR
ncbi:MAG: hypothetical protein ACI94Y_003213 [Maribacter sp.]|jgi:hypothetical protein